MRLIDGEERDLDRTEELDVLGLVERLRCHIEKLRLACYDVGLDLVDSRLGERRVDKMRYVVILTEISHCINLILHQGNKRRNDNSCAFHQQRW